MVFSRLCLSSLTAAFRTFSAWWASTNHFLRNLLCLGHDAHLCFGTLGLRSSSHSHLIIIFTLASLWIKINQWKSGFKGHIYLEIQTFKHKFFLSLEFFLNGRFVLVFSPSRTAPYDKSDVKSAGLWCLGWPCAEYMSTEAQRLTDHTEGGVASVWKDETDAPHHKWPIF